MLIYLHSLIAESNIKCVLTFVQATVYALSAPQVLVPKLLHPPVDPQIHTGIEDMPQIQTERKSSASLEVFCSSDLQCQVQVEVSGPEELDQEGVAEVQLHPGELLSLCSESQLLHERLHPLRLQRQVVQLAARSARSPHNGSLHTGLTGQTALQLQVVSYCTYTTQGAVNIARVRPPHGHAHCHAHSL